MRTVAKHGFLAWACLCLVFCPIRKANTVPAAPMHLFAASAAAVTPTATVGLQNILVRGARPANGTVINGRIGTLNATCTVINGACTFTFPAGVINPTKGSIEYWLAAEPNTTRRVTLWEQVHIK